MKIIFLLSLAIITTTSQAAEKLNFYSCKLKPIQRVQLKFQTDRNIFFNEIIANDQCKLVTDLNTNKAKDQLGQSTEITSQDSLHVKNYQNAGHGPSSWDLCDSEDEACISNALAGETQGAYDWFTTTYIDLNESQRITIQKKLTNSQSLSVYFLEHESNYKLSGEQDTSHSYSLKNTSIKIK